MQVTEKIFFVILFESVICGTLLPDHLPRTAFYMNPAGRVSTLPDVLMALPQRFRESLPVCSKEQGTRKFNNSKTSFLWIKEVFYAVQK